MEDDQQLDAFERFVRLEVPATLAFRDLTVRSVASAIRALRPMVGVETSEAEESDFDAAVISAVGEAFNNLAIHGYRGLPVGTVELCLFAEPHLLTIEFRDAGNTFELPDQPELAEELPESGMGLFIIKSFMDGVDYVPGPPNLLRMRRRWRSTKGSFKGASEAV